MRSTSLKHKSDFKEASSRRGSWAQPNGDGGGIFNDGGNSATLALNNCTAKIAALARRDVQNDLAKASHLPA